MIKFVDEDIVDEDIVKLFDESNKMIKISSITKENRLKNLNAFPTSLKNVIVAKNPQKVA